MSRAAVGSSTAVHISLLPAWGWNQNTEEAKPSEAQDNRMEATN